jgi:RNA polymerase sigma-70 factor (ECF subfamily)
MFARLATSTRPALVNGAVGAVSSQDGRLTAVLRFIVAHQKIAAIDILADPSGWAHLA